MTKAGRCLVDQSEEHLLNLGPDEPAQVELAAAVAEVLAAEEAEAAAEEAAAEAEAAAAAAAAAQEADPVDSAVQEEEVQVAALVAAAAAVRLLLALQPHRVVHRLLVQVEETSRVVLMRMVMVDVILKRKRNFVSNKRKEIPLLV